MMDQQRRRQRKQVTMTRYRRKRARLGYGSRIAKTLALVLSLSSLVSAQILASSRSHARPWRSTPRYERNYYGQSSRPSSSSQPRQDLSIHFLDYDNWMEDKRSRLFQVDVGRKGRRRPNDFSWTSKLVFVNIAAFVVQVFRPDFTNWGVKLSDKLLAGQELHRLITPMFLHGGIFHLYTNMYSLRQVGTDVERIFGPGRFLATYVVSGISGTLLSAVKSPNPSLGASGAVFGVVGAYFVFLTRNEWLLGRVGESMSLAIGQTMLLNVVLGVMNPMIDNWAHLGGALGGASMAHFFGPRLYLTELPSGGRLLIDRPILRLPRSIESIPEKVTRQCQRVFGMMHVGRVQSDTSEKPWRGPSRNYRPQPPRNRSIKPGKV